MKSIRFTSLHAFLLIGIFLCVYRISNVNETETSWDVLGYYIPLPATFIYDDPMMSDRTWLKKINEEKQLSGTLYMVTTSPKGESMYFFLLGTALLYLPFFLIGHLSAAITGMPMDGFSLPYQYALVCGAIIYTLIGFYYFRKILRLYFSEAITGIVLLTTFFATNTVHHLSIKNLETVNLLFMFVCIVTWFTIKWHKEQKTSSLIVIGSAITLMALIKPSEIIIVLLPLFWNVTSRKTAKEKLGMIARNRNQFFIAIGVCLLIASPQIAYWLMKTGKPFYDSYNNPGVGLDLFPPHSVDALFSYRKGWLIYTPIMIFYLWGLRFLYQRDKNLFVPIIIYFSITFIIITSWTEWWYGAGFSNRPLIASYPLLAIGFGYLLMQLATKNWFIKSLFVGVVAIFTAFNQFQWWQFQNYILDPYRTTKAYYWATFLKTSVTAEDRNLLLVARDFSGEMNFSDSLNYTRTMIQTIKMNEKNLLVDTSNGTNYYKVKAEEEYIAVQKMPFFELTSKDHVWVKVTFDVRFPNEFSDQYPCFSFSMERRKGDYGYFPTDIKKETNDHRWKKYTIYYQTPEIRNKKDQLKTQIWKRGKQGFDLRNMKMEVFERNRN